MNLKRIISAAAVCAILVTGSAMAATRYIVSSVHFRTGAGTQYKSMKVLSEGTKVSTTGKTKKVKTKNATSKWAQIKYNGKTGWVCTKYLTWKAPEAKPTPTLMY